MLLISIGRTGQMITKTFRYRLLPTDQQIQIIRANVSAMKQVYNHFLKEWKQSLSKTGMGLSSHYFDQQLQKIYNASFADSHVDYLLLQNQYYELERDFQKASRKNTAVREKKEKYRFCIHYGRRYEKFLIRVGRNHADIPMIGRLKYVNSREREGRLAEVQITGKPDGSFYLSLTCYVSTSRQEATGKFIGIDLGLKEFVALSDGRRFRNPCYGRKLQGKLSEERRKLSKLEQNDIDHYEEVIKNGRKVKKPVYRKPLTDCRNYQKQRIRSAAIEERIADKRRDFEQKLSTYLIRNYDVICIEDLAIAPMKINHNITYALTDASWYKFISMLDYKACWYGKQLIRVNRYYPSSQLCSNCGYQNRQLKNLAIREWVCPKCGMKHDRDVNAARNILKEGLRSCNRTLPSGRREVQNA